jgi:hydroxymethylglutaryl-CoA reductase (NADPH)
MSLRDFKSIVERRKFIEKTGNTSLEAVSYYPDKLDEASYKNCENMIGAISIPLGVAGPLKVRNSKLEIRNYYIPLATTEGALVASVSRGCKAVSESGGVYVKVQVSGMTRGSIFKTKSLEESFLLKEFVLKSKKDMEDVAKSTSSHITLLSTLVKIIGRQVFVRFSFDTGEAMGMNMVTIATSAICKWLEEKLDITTLSVAGNFDVDKKPSHLNALLGRGRSLWAECEISKDIIQRVLKTTPEKIYEINIAKNLVGSAIAGSLGFNAHFANIVAAIYLATGQDPAHVTEGSLGITTTELTKSGLLISVYLPNVNVGTVGGGTTLPAQKEALSILGIKNGEKGSADKLAGCIAGAVLAGELSLLASLGEGSLGRAHEILARGKK